MAGGFAFELRRQRRARGMTLAQLAEQMGVTVSMTSMLETGARDPNRKLIQRAVVALTCDPVEAARLYLTANMLPPGGYRVGDDGQIVQVSRVG